MRPILDHDRLFKELIKTFFFEFVDLFVFPARMFHYFARLLATHGLAVYPVAVLSYDTPKSEAPHGYDVVIDGWRVMAFEYRALQLNRMPWRKYLRQDNPVSLALAAKMQMEKAERRKVKLECLRLLWTSKLDAARMEMIAGFINSYLVLADEDEKWLEEEMATVAPESAKKVLFWTHWHDKGYDEGLERGREEARAEMALRTLRRNWTRRFGSDAPTDVLDAAQKLNLDRLDQFGDAVLDFRQPSEAEGWLTPPAVAAENPEHGGPGIPEGQ